MFSNYVKTAWRNLLRSKGFSVINILGLATGLAVAMLIGLWVWNQYSYDRFLPNYQQVYQAHFRFNKNGEIREMTATSLPLATVLKKDIPEIQDAIHTDWMSAHGLMVRDKKFYIKGGMVDEDFFKVFPYTMLQGNTASALKDIYSIVLTRSTAISLFGNQDPLGKIVRIDNIHDLKVTGVVEDPPSNATMQFQYLVPFSYNVATQPWVKNAMNTWDNNSFPTYVTLKPGVSIAQITPKLNQIVRTNVPDEFKEVKTVVFLQPMSHWHLYSDFKNGVEAGGFIDYVKMFTIIGILVLIIACINFMNLSTARSEKRAREVGIRKTVGSGRSQLIIQFLVESIVITAISFMLALLIVQLVLPSFNRLTRTEIRIPYSSVGFWLIMIGLILLTGVLAGGRPAFYLSSFRPVKVLKGIITGNSAALPRKILVVLQFTCSIALIIGTMIVYQQIKHAKDRPEGYNPNRLMMTDASDDLRHNYEALKNDLLKTGVVSDVSAASSPATDIWSWYGLDDWPGKKAGEIQGIAVVDVSNDYFSTVGMKLLKGRNFSGSLGQDSLNVILNEAAMKLLHFNQGLNQVITWHSKQQRVRVIGVVRDALMLSPFNPAEPTFFCFNPNSVGSIMYRLSPTVNTHEALAKISPIFNRYNPAFPYIYQFADKEYAQKFDLETLVGKLAGWFAALAILISCLGLFGLAAYMAEQRHKEISIRKVLGASVSQVWMLLSIDFLILVGISCVIASPVAWYFLNGWLLKYTYRITIGPWVFIAAALAAVAITLVTISFQSIRAAIANPVQGLRSE
jgi:putative ABC transport system permease protein